MNQQDVTQIAMQAAGVAKKALAVKVGAVAAVLFLLGLVLMGALVPLPAAHGASCQDTGPGTGSAAPDRGDTPPATGSVHAQQLANAQIIDQAAQKLHLPGTATLIALMTAMQESTLQNLDHGDRDSLGLFQQRPSMNWGTREQIMNPAFAAESFYQGRGGNKGLIGVKNWQSLPPGDVAQAVQGSAYPKLYAGHETAMRALAKQAHIDLTRGGSATGATAGGTEPSAGTPPAVTCGVVDPGTGKGGTFTDGRATWQLNNPRTVQDALAWARAHAGANSTKEWERACLKFVAIAYGWSASGVGYAIDHYTVVPADMRHNGDRHPPPGALMYWTTGHRAGHIAIYLGNGQIVSNDITRPGYLDIVPADAIEQRWRAMYVGWTPPVFPRAS
ncbi:peptidase M23 [Streptomyces sp. H10-C2]|uniref:peptidase M23 n=1 Tax=unclassified Streptomyces TaxID=2593676 RepID=UPI0024B9593B|nr:MULTISPECIES: peptidase M23 [unclassified Streptomyces]MDJ0346712.1 peptidase M23 [Streptomyces sp. PH10-H1]MDJ0374620.1 peptidase M23 [Streptomyces sp. H10-C2]